jgi:hypothetical protein
MRVMFAYNNRGLFFLVSVCYEKKTIRVYLLTSSQLKTNFLLLQISKKKRRYKLLLDFMKPNLLNPMQYSL